MQPNVQNIELARSSVTRDMSLQQPIITISTDQTQSVLPPSLSQSLATTNARLSNIKQHLQEHLNAAERQTVNNKQPTTTKPVTGSESASLVEQIEQLRNTSIVSDDEASEQTAPNENILQIVAQIPNHPLQKFAQKYLVDRPKSTAELHFKSAPGDTTPNKNTSPTTPSSKLNIECLLYTYTHTSFSNLNTHSHT